MNFSGGRTSCKNQRGINVSESGFALPTALLLIVVLTAAGLIFTNVATSNLRIVSLEDASTDTFEVSEGVVHQLISQLSIQPHLWREKTSLSVIPSGYTEYSPSTYTASNGIPTCSGDACLRSLYPTGGGLIKNFGPIGDSGDTVNSGASITNQLDAASLPTADLTLNGLPAWVQVEHMEEIALSAASLGADLANNPDSGNNGSAIRFRLTGTTQKTIKGRNGKSTVVITVEVPPV